MGKIWMLSRGNIRKNKGQTISFAIIIIIAAIMLNMGLITFLNFGKSFDSKWDRNHYGDTFMVMYKREYQNSFLEYVKDRREVEEVELRDGILMDGTIHYNGGTLDMMHLFYNMEEEHTMGRISLIEEIKRPVEKPVYLSYLMKSGGGYELGDDYTITTASGNYSFTVAGFVEDLNLGSINLGILGVHLKGKEFDSLRKELGSANEAVSISCKISDKHQGKKIYSNMGDVFVNNGVTYLNGNYYSITKMAYTVTANIGSMIIVAFALIIVVVSLLVIHFRVANSLEEEMENMGVLKSLGYTSRQIMASVLIQYMAVTLFGTIIGIFSSYGLLPFLAAAFDAQTGILWEQGFDFISSSLTIIVIISLVGIVAYTSVYRVKRMQPITALRSGITTHNFKKNYVPLEKARGNIHVLLALKKSIQNAKQNIMMAIVMIAVMFACLFAGVMYYNIGIDNKVLLYTVSSEISDVSFDLENTTDSAWILKEIQEMEDVNKALYYDFRPVMCDNEYLAVYVTENFDILENNKCYQGRNPIHDNEVALGGGAAQAYNKKLGDTITLKIGDRKEDYLITGLIQSANSGGYDAELTTKAYKKIFPQFKPDYLYVYLEEGTDKDAFIASVIKQYGEFIAASTNFEETYKSQMGVYTVIVSIIAIIIVLITSTLVALILYLLIKTIIIRRSQEFGIMKAIGYTSYQLMLQISLSFLPVILFGIILGGALGAFGINPLIGILFRSIGIMKIDFVISIPMILGIGIGLCVFSFGVCILVSMRIRKITAYHLINE